MKRPAMCSTMWKTPAPGSAIPICGVKSYSAAQRMVQNDEELEFLYVGERKFNIMAANSEYVMNEEASRWFIDTNFLGSGERVLLAVNVSYPIGDEIQEAYLAYEQREPVLLVSIVGAAGSGILLVLLLALLTAAAGRQEKGGAALLSGFDRIPTEIAAGLCLIVGVSWYLLVTEVAAGYLFRLLSFRGQLLLTAVTEYGVILFGFLSFVRRHKAGTLWSNSVCYAVLLGCRQAYSARKNSQRLVIGYVAFFALNIFFVGFFGLPGAVMALDRRTGQAVSQTGFSGRLVWAALRGDSVFALEEGENGAVLSQLSLPELNLVGGWALPAAVEERALFDCDGAGRFYYTDAQGSLWFSDLGGEPRQVEGCTGVSLFGGHSPGHGGRLHGLRLLLGPLPRPRRLAVLPPSLLPLLPAGGGAFPGPVGLPQLVWLRKRGTGAPRPRGGLSFGPDALRFGPGRAVPVPQRGGTSRWSAPPWRERLWALCP